jgi:ribosomal protein S18 acetylase RimI-like enzyme
MVQLIPMTEAEFDAFMEISMRDQAQGQVRAGNWPAEQADELIKQLRNQFLPGGLATPNHFFFAIKDQDSGAEVGGLWYTVMEEDGKRLVFVVDIQVYDEYRRRGYGTQAFRMMEEQAREMGITTISLHVFKHNHSARAMYEKLGYVGADNMMSKELGTGC